jgi:hypothetical protein
MDKLRVSQDVLFQLETVAKDRLVRGFAEVTRRPDVKVGLFHLDLKGNEVSIDEKAAVSPFPVFRSISSRSLSPCQKLPSKDFSHAPVLAVSLFQQIVGG